MTSVSALLQRSGSSMLVEVSINVGMHFSDISSLFTSLDLGFSNTATEGAEDKFEAGVIRAFERASWQVETTGLCFPRSGRYSCNVSNTTSGRTASYNDYSHSIDEATWSFERFRNEILSREHRKTNTYVDLGAL